MMKGVDTCVYVKVKTLNATQHLEPYRGTSLIRNGHSLGLYSRPVLRALWWSVGGGGFL